MLSEVDLHAEAAEAEVAALEAGAAGVQVVFPNLFDLAGLKARRQALIREFLGTTVPFLASRDEVRGEYAQALAELHVSLGHEGEDGVGSLTAVTGRELEVEIEERSGMWIMVGRAARC